ncbi:MAG TPA: transporter substrate-binding domain-containing protein [Pseudomonas sp.]|nr:transporter substrate-binding domain-containing protein [Pseudomonas sp.]
MIPVLSWLLRRGQQVGLPLLLALNPVLPASGQTLRVVTEEYPPYNYTENGRLTGLSTEIIQAALAAVQLQGQFQSLPWARAYDIAQNSENVLIYTIVRTPHREALFKWVAPLAPMRRYLFSWAQRPISLQHLDDAKHYQIGTVNEDVGEQFLVAQGFAKGRNLQSSAQYAFNYEKLKLGRIDLWVIDERVAHYLARQAGDDPLQVLSKSYPLPELEGEHYMAFGKQTPDALVERVRQGLERIKHNGVLDSIQKKWGLHASDQ